MADKIKLNKTKLNELEALDGKRRIVWDSAIQGYGVRIMPSGSKTLFFQTRFKGEVIRVTIARYTGTAESAEQARKKAVATVSYTHLTLPTIYSV